jgi:diguanylate cyclase (GGDEF)-like protein
LFVPRTKLRNRVLLLTTAFAFVLFAITFGLSWRASVAQQRWSRLVGVETRAIAALEELIRAQNAFHSRFTADRSSAPRYRIVEQLLRHESLEGIDTRPLRARVIVFRDVIGEENPRAEDVEATSYAIGTEAMQLIGARKREIARQLPALEHEARALMSSGLAVAWILVLVSFAVVQTTLRKVVQPLEELAVAADKIAAGDLTARAPVGGDYEVAKLGVALNHMAEELKARARTDDLTALPNFRAFRERIDAEIERADRYPERFGILVLDLDRFKKYNDSFGHLAGNDALQRVSRALRGSLRTVDFPARYGGEEFAVIVPQIEHESLHVIAERIRAAVEALPAPPGGAQVTVSIGAAIFPVDGKSAEALFQVADERLYEAKRLGRNRVVVTGGPSTGAVEVLDQPVDRPRKSALVNGR